MKIEIKIPAVGESVQEAVLAQWYKKDGESVKKDEILFVLETDKVTLEISAEADGVLKILVPEGETVAIGTVVGTIETEAAGEAKEEPKPAPEKKKEEPPEEAKKEAPKPPPAPAPKEEQVKAAPPFEALREEHELLSPSVRRLIAENRLDSSRIKGTGPEGRITKGDVLLYMEETSRGAEPSAPAPRPAAPEPPGAMAEKEKERKISGEEQVTRKPMSRIRQRIAERLLEARQNTAMLTTFNEIDMSRIQMIRAQFKESFRTKYGVSLGLMSFFIKACVVALKEFPEVNAFIEGRDIVYHNYYHIGVAVGAERGLVVPVIRNVDKLGFFEIEKAIVDYVKKIKENRLELSDLEGGTFTVSNGGVYGSLLSTPILNTPQSGILGMHKIEDRPMAINGQVVIRPMMYVALSYDHRIIDGAQAVTFLKRIKECIENPERIMMEI